MAGADRRGADAVHACGWYLTPELWLALAAGAIGSTPWVPALAARLARRRAAAAGWRVSLLEHGGADGAARRVDHADGRAHLQPVHLFPILMQPAAASSVAAVVVADLAAAGGEPRRRRRRAIRAPRTASSRRSRTRRIVASIAAFPAGFSRWFDDHFGFRVDAGALVRREPPVRARRVAVGGGRQGRATAGSSTATTRRSRTTPTSSR